MAQTWRAGRRALAHAAEAVAVLLCLLALLHAPWSGAPASADVRSAVAAIGTAAAAGPDPPETEPDSDGRGWAATVSVVLAIGGVVLLASAMVLRRRLRRESTAFRETVRWPDEDHGEAP